MKVFLCRQIFLCYKSYFCRKFPGTEDIFRRLCSEGKKVVPYEPFLFESAFMTWHGSVLTTWQGDAFCVRLHTFPKPLRKNPELISFMMVQEPNYFFCYSKWKVMGGRLTYCFIMLIECKKLSAVTLAVIATLRKAEYRALLNDFYLLKRSGHPMEIAKIQVDPPLP